MKNKPEKQKDMEALREQLAKAQNVFLTGYEKLKVGQDFELRKAIRGAGASRRRRRAYTMTMLQTGETAAPAFRCRSV